MEIFLTFILLIIVIAFLSFLRKLKKNNSSNCTLPWEGRESIYQFIEKNITPESCHLKDSIIHLPDDEKLFKSGKLRWVAGGLDSNFSFHGGGEEDKDNASKIAKLIISISKSGSKKSKIALYKILENDVIIDTVDPALEMAVNAGISGEPYLHDFARFLSTQSPDRGPVKFGIALLGLMSDPKDLETVKTLGKHEEFTLYSAVAISNILQNPENDLFELAQAVNGWGKINIVERLVDTNNKEIQQWLLLEGYKNSVMYEYMAYTCAVSGNLHLALEHESITKELFDSTGEIMEALISGGPAEDIDDFEHSAIVIMRYLHHFPSFPRELKHFLVLQSIQSYLSDPDWKVSEHEKNGWSTASWDQTLRIIQDLLNNEEWYLLTEQGLLSDDDMLFYEADRSAKLLGIDTWDIHWKRLEEKSADSGRWYPVMAQANPERIDSIIDLAYNELPLNQISTGPADEMGLGADFEPHSCLDVILQDLSEYPGKGKRLILTGLNSPVVRNRYMAITALTAWSHEMLDNDITQALESAFLNEPDLDLKNQIKGVIEGKIME